MKGLAILGILAGLIAGALWLLFRPSDSDLRRIEDETRGTLSACGDELNDAAAALNRLRGVRPNIPALDRDLSTAQKRRELLAKELDREAGESPGRGVERAPYIDQRKKTRDQAAADLATVRALRERIRLLDDFVRDALPRLTVMLTLSSELVSARDTLAARKVTIDDHLSVKLQTLTTQANAARGLAAQVLDSGTSDLGQMKTIAQTAKNEIERIIGEQEELLRQLKAA